jgi:hypothetical protein
MESLLKSTGLIQRAHGLIRLRWLGVIALAVAAFATCGFSRIPLLQGQLP